MIGKYAAENGPMKAAKHYTVTYGIEINKFTARRFRDKYI